VAHVDAEFSVVTNAGVTPRPRPSLLLANIALRGVVDQSVFRTVGPARKTRFPSAACTRGGVQHDGSTDPLFCGER